MKRTWKRLLSAVAAWVLALVTVLTSVLTDPYSCLVAKADGGVTLKLHYFREDGDYAPWDVWLWPEGGEGAGYAFAEEEGEMVATMEVPAGTTKIGYIVRTQDWSKDIDMDQFIDIAEVVSGTVHAYVISGEEGCRKEYGEDVMTGTKLKTAVYDGESTITLKLTGPMSKEQQESLYVRGRLGDTKISAVTETGAESAEVVYDLTLEEALDGNRNYRVGFEGEEFPVRMPNVYSTDAFEAAYTYEGEDLGAVYSPEKTVFRVWAPTAEELYVNLYESGSAWKDDLKEQLPMTADEKGTWVLEVPGDLEGTYYTYTAILDGLRVEACDPYARTTGYNGKRAMVIDLDATDPAGWDADTDPHAGEAMTDAVIYELHIRDFSADAASGISAAGKYIAFTEKGTGTPGGAVTGTDYLKDLGVTHLHLLPFYDFGSIDETHQSTPGYNWGYDPVNYNVPEGSYSTDPSDGHVRVREVKQMVQALHEAGISVVMDVVYNHVYSAQDFCVNRLVPGYFSRVNEDGTYSNGSGCGNDTASERSMVRKYIVDSVCYLADEYHIDGFRFDLVGLLDTETVNEIVSKVHEKHPNVIFYGEGWTLGTQVTKEGVTLATQQSSGQTPGFAYFNDNIRDGLKGSVFSTGETGWASGSQGKERAMTASFLAAETWSKNPLQIIQYASCHDNMTLYDRIAVVRTDLTDAEWIRMNNLAAAFYMTAQGVPFLQAGEELLRTKVKPDGSFDSNSYASGDEVNKIRWETLEDPKVAAVHDYYKGLISFRKAHGLLRLRSEADVAARVEALPAEDKNVLVFRLDNTDGAVTGESAKEICLVFNPNQKETVVELPEGVWGVYIEDGTVSETALEVVKGQVTCPQISAMALIREADDTPLTADAAGSEEPAAADLSEDAAGTEASAEPAGTSDAPARSAALPIACGAVAGAGIIAGIIAFLRKRKK
ncbi:MAG: type I pullulanase [Lachnospiraceae bacterium]|nr:type I pullulanase [Lachnospiraceae bacterium]